MILCLFLLLQLFGIFPIFILKLCLGLMSSEGPIDFLLNGVPLYLLMKVLFMQPQIIIRRVMH